MMPEQFTFVPYTSKKAVSKQQKLDDAPVRKLYSDPVKEKPKDLKLNDISHFIILSAANYYLAYDFDSCRSICCL